jgi:hypothetical protein
MGSGSSKGHYDDPRFRHESLEQWARRCAEERQRVAQQVMNARVGLSVVAWMCVGGCVAVCLAVFLYTANRGCVDVGVCVCVCVAVCLAVFLYIAIQRDMCWQAEPQGRSLL